MSLDYSIYVSGVTFLVTAVTSIIVLAKWDSMEKSWSKTASSLSLVAAVLCSMNSVSRAYDILLSKPINGFIQDTLSGLRKNVSAAVMDNLEFYFKAVVKRYCQLAPMIICGMMPFLVKKGVGHDPAVITVLCTSPLIIAALELIHKAIHTGLLKAGLPSWGPSVISEMLTGAITAVVAIPLLFAMNIGLKRNSAAVTEVKKISIMVLAFSAFGALHGLLCGGGINSFDTSTYQGAFLESTVTLGLLVGVGFLSYLAWRAVSTAGEIDDLTKDFTPSF